MPEIGQSLLHYSITEKIGKGGMGEVYRAKDTKLGRDVAIKVLPEEFARDADRIARFQREAKLLASLNNPNIAAIHGLEESSGTHFLVLELIEGYTLADRIKGGPIPVEESLKLALQIAEALEAAHEKGVIHRDLKPANIKVTPEGKVKVLDFGLAKAFAGEQEVNLSNSPTLSEAATLQGVILGTAAYMSPEQARGKPVDRRTDIWAYGCVLYEMLTGKAAFQGEDVTEILAAVVKSGVNLDLLPSNIHSRVREVIIRSLQKEQKKRYRDIGEAHYEIEQVLSDPSGVFIQPSLIEKPRKKLRIGLPWVAAITVLSLIVAGVAGWFLKPTPPPEPKHTMRFEYELPEGQQLRSGPISNLQTNMAVSPDGTQLVYATREGLYLHSMNELDTRLISGTEDSAQPCFSPNSQWIAYISFTEQKLKKVAISGGAPVVVCNISAAAGDPSWDLDDTILYSDVTKGIMRVSADGGTPENLIKATVADAAKGGFPTQPHILPDGETLLFTNLRTEASGIYEIVIQSLKSGERRVLIPSGYGATYLPSGHIVYTFSDNNLRSLLAVPFDLEKLEVTGGQVSLLEGVSSPAFSDSGTVAYIPQTRVATGAAGAVSSGNTLVWVDREGKEESLGAVPDAYSDLKISPDGNEVAFTITSSGNADIWIWDISHKNRRRLTFDKATDASPVWTPDGKRIVFRSNRSGGLGGLYWQFASGIGNAELLFSKPDALLIPFSFSPDGKFLAVYELSLAPLGVDIGMLTMEGNRELKEILHEKYFEAKPQISPDGRYVAYQSDESGKGEIFVNSFPDVTKERRQVSNGGGNGPLWSPDGKEIFYRNGDATMAVKVELEPSFKYENPKILFQGNYISDTDRNLPSSPWDIHPITKKFLMIKPPSAGASTTEGIAAPQQKIIIVLNWLEELKQRVPTK